MLYMKVNLPSKTTLIQYSSSNYTPFQRLTLLSFFIKYREPLIILLQ